MDIDDEQRFTAFVVARERSLLGFGLLLTADRQAAEDLVQQALTQLFLHWRRVRVDEAEKWVRRVMINANISRWRGNRWVTQVPVRSGDPVVSADPEGQVDTHEELRQALASLGRKQRTAVVLRYYVGLSEAETADYMNCSLGTVKSQTSRGLRSLREHLQVSTQQEVLP